LTLDLLVGQCDGTGLLRFDGITGLPLGSFTHGTPDPGANWGYSCAAFGPNGDLYVQMWNYGAPVYRFDGNTGAYISSITTSSYAECKPGIAFGPDGYLYVRESINLHDPFSIGRYDPINGGRIDTFAAPGAVDAGYGMRFGPNGDLFVGAGNRIQRVRQADGQPLGDFVSPASGGLGGCFDIAFGPDGNLYVADTPNRVVRRYSGTNGTHLDNFITTHLSEPFGLAFAYGDLYVTELTSVLRFDCVT